LDIDSIPPATTTRASSSPIVRAPIATASIPEAQTLFTVSAVVVFASPALKAAWRAGA
jgi:hypothetical protein